MAGAWASAGRCGALRGTEQHGGARGRAGLGVGAGVMGCDAVGWGGAAAHASVAQWIEHRPSNPQVPGSSPGGGTNGILAIPTIATSLSIRQKRPFALFRYANGYAWEGQDSGARQGRGGRLPDGAGRVDRPVELPPDPVTGRRRRKMVRPRSKAEAMRKLPQVQAEIARTGDIVTGSKTLADWLSVWLERDVVPSLKPSTAADCRASVDRGHTDRPRASGLFPHRSAPGRGPGHVPGSPRPRCSDPLGRVGLGGPPPHLGPRLRSPYQRRPALQGPGVLS